MLRKLRWLIIGSFLALSACYYAEIAISADANMTCYWNDDVVWSGQVNLVGMGLEGFEQYLTGSWTFYKTPEGREDSTVRCDLTVMPPSEN